MQAARQKPPPTSPHPTPLPARSDSAFQTLWQGLHVDDDTLQLDHDTTWLPRHLEPDTAEHQRAARLPRLVVTAEDGQPELQLLEVLGQGGMGIVQAATQTALQRTVAVKRIRPDQQSPHATAELLREARITGRLEHPSIIPVHALGLDHDGAPLLVMKRVEGVSWRARLEQDGAPPQGTALDRHLGILAQVCNAVHFAHSRGVLHRDLKPDNVMLGSFGEVYVLDWGVAIEFADAPAGARAETWPPAGGIVGTPGYMAPEMVGGGGLGVHTDVYLLGGLLHTILTGRLRHTAADVYSILYAAWTSAPVDYDATVPAELAALVNRATACDPAERPASAEAFRLAIEDFLRHRHSTVLSAEAEVRLGTLAEVLDQAPVLAGAGADPELAAENARIAAELSGYAYHLFGECRFGFEQALRIWPENTQAQAGLAASLERMARFEVQQGDLRAARLLAGQMADVPSDLQAALDDLAERVKQDESELTKLKQLERDADFELGARLRSDFAIALAVVWAVLPAAFGVLELAGYYTVSLSGYFFSALFFALFSTAALWLGRVDLLQNKVNRAYVRSVTLAVIAVVAHRAVVWAQATPLPQALVQDMLLFATVVGGMAATIDLRLGWSASAYLVAALVTPRWPQYAYFFIAASNLVGMGWAAYVWRPRGACAEDVARLRDHLQALDGLAEATWRGKGGSAGPAGKLEAR